MYHAAFCKTKELLSLSTDWIKKEKKISDLQVYKSNTSSNGDQEMIL